MCEHWHPLGNFAYAPYANQLAGIGYQPAFGGMDGRLAAGQNVAFDAAAFWSIYGQAAPESKLTKAQKYAAEVRERKGMKVKAKDSA